jgi:CitMHS family citrate-Mg2+:H+ or citrate-Ca2+:H+ symporter
VPIAFAIVGGFSSSLGRMMYEGIRDLAPTGEMLTFAILYFGIMIDAGLFDPVVRLVDGNPVKIVVGTATIGDQVLAAGFCCASKQNHSAANCTYRKRLTMKLDRAFHPRC